MQLLVWMKSPRKLIKTRPGRWRVSRLGLPDVLFQTSIVRVIGPVRGGIVQADGFLPDRYAAHALSDRIQPDGSYRFDVEVKKNRRSLTAFLASGLIEMNGGEWL